MTETGITEKGMDARVARTRAAVLRSATDLLVDGGPSAVAIDAIVAHSGVAKSTIYRHWESRDDILVSVIENCAPSIDPPDPSLGFEGGLRLVAREFYNTMTDPEWARIIPALLLLKAHQASIAEVEERLGSRQDETLDILLRAGIDEGYLTPDTTVEDLAAMLIGPLMFAHLTGRPDLTPEFADRIVDGLLHRTPTVIN
jgi:AcrR family transcriptional regulator